MTPELWERLKALFNSAIERDSHEREAFIEAACGDNVELKALLSALVRADRASLCSLDKPLADLSGLPDTFLLPGDLLANRYRILSFIGQGGMGHVYEAEDTVLRQRVALKFLRPEFSDNSLLLHQLHVEVETARRVTHKNVCRVHDIVETKVSSGGTLHFITMEFVEGESLARLRSRKETMPTATALSICSQISAGLAAVHGGSVIHRDIKPGNILIDRYGNIKLADFGLAIDLHKATTVAFAGTPGYIAPEIVAGGECTELSDIYSLGVVCFELLTGDSPGKGSASQASDLRKARPDLTDATCRLIVSCLAPNPAERPPNVIEVLKGIPLDDALDAALARGDIPTPEMVAEAGSDEPIHLWNFLPVFLVVCIALLGIWLVAPYGDFLGYARPVLSPAAMEQKSKNLLHQFGYLDSRRAAVFVLSNNISLLDYFSFMKDPNQKQGLRWAGQGSLLLSYRVSDADSIFPTRIRNGTGDSEESSFASIADPSPVLPGMRMVVVDSNGHLIRLLANPTLGELRRQSDQNAMWISHRQPDWQGMLMTTGVDLKSIKEITGSEYVSTVPPFPFTTIRVWRAHYIGHPEFPLIVEASAWQDHFDWIAVRAPWNASPEEKGQPALARIGVPIIILCCLAMAAITARYNLRHRRGDTRSALRLASISAVFCLLVSGAGWYPGNGSIVERIDWMFLEIESALTIGAGIWLAYVAVEPLARVRIPRLLISSSKLLRGKWDSPLVGKEMILGSTLAVVCCLCYTSIHAYTWLRWPGASLSIAPVMSLAGGQHAIYSLTWRIGTLPEQVALYAVLFVILRVLLRNTIRASCVFFLCMILFPATHGSILAALPIYAVLGAFGTFVLARSGLVAAASFMFTLKTVDRCVWPHEWNWMLWSTFLSIGLIVALLGFGFFLASGIAKKRRIDKLH